MQQWTYRRHKTAIRTGVTRTVAVNSRVACKGDRQFFLTKKGGRRGGSSNNLRRPENGGALQQRLRVEEVQSWGECRRGSTTREWCSERRRGKANTRKLQSRKRRQRKTQTIQPAPSFTANIDVDDGQNIIYRF